MKPFAFALALATISLAALSTSGETHAVTARPPFELSDGAATPEALVRRLIAALEKNDENALHAVRVTEREYREIIAPGTVAPGQPPRQTDAKVGEFYWRMLDVKSRDLGRELLKQYGGRHLEIVKVDYTRQPLDYAWYRATGEVRVHVRNEKGQEAVVPAGWVAEVDGRYKFIGLGWAD